VVFNMVGAPGNGCEGLKAAILKSGLVLKCINDLDGKAV